MLYYFTVLLPAIIYRHILLLGKKVNTIAWTYKTNKLGSDNLHYKITICFTKWDQFKFGIFEIWPNLQKFNLYRTFPEYIKHRKWVIFIWTWFYESVVDQTCCCFFERQIVYSVRHLWRMNKTVIMWYFFSKTLVLFCFEACVAKVESAFPRPCL